MSFCRCNASTLCWFEAQLHLLMYKCRVYYPVLPYWTIAQQQINSDQGVHSLGKNQSRPQRQAPHQPVDLPEGHLGEVPLANGHRSSNHKCFRLQSTAAVEDECVCFLAICPLFADQPAIKRDRTQTRQRLDKTTIGNSGDKYSISPYCTYDIVHVHDCVKQGWHRRDTINTNDFSPKSAGVV